MAVIDSVGACHAAERIRETVAEMAIDWKGQTVNMTVSVGCTVGHETETLDHLLTQADSALYRAKSEGRNRVAMARDDDVQTIPGT